MTPLIHPTPDSPKPALRPRTWLKRITITLVLFVFVGMSAFAIWAYTAPLMNEALPALESNSRVAVSQVRWIEFTPVGKETKTGFIFYPGGRVEPRAYAPFIRDIADAGYYAVIVPMPLNLAFFSPDRADEVMAANPTIEKWVIGGHSLGGAMAADYVFDHPNAMQGLVLWASYPQASKALTRYSELTVLSLFGTADGLATPADIEASRANLPPSARVVAIEGGNHAQFAWYGDQPGDRPATITREQQQAQVVEETVRLLQEVETQ